MVRKLIGSVVLALFLLGLGLSVLGAPAVAVAVR